MNRRTNLAQAVGLFATLLFLGACGAPQPAPTSVPAAHAPSSTPASTQAPSATPPAASAAAAGAAEEWDYLAIGPYRMVGYAEDFAAQIEDDLDVKITVHDWHVRGLTCSSLVTRLRHNQLLRELISGAKVVTFEIPVPFLFPLTGREALYTSLREGTCGGEDNQDCLREALARYEEDVDAVLAELLALRSTSDAIVRAGDCCLPAGVSRVWKEQDMYEILRPYWDAANEYAAHSAADHGIPAARVSPLMTELEGEGIPSEYEYPDSEWEAASETGAAIMASAYGELGYEPLAP